MIHETCSNIVAMPIPVPSMYSDESLDSLTRDKCEYPTYVHVSVSPEPLWDLSVASLTVCRSFAYR